MSTSFLPNNSITVPQMSTPLNFIW